MTTSNSTRGPRGFRDRGLTTKRREVGTTLVEILVVIVIFLIGILAVVQIFPRGFRLLLTSRNNSMATAMGRDEVERLKANPELLPEAILAVRYQGTTPVIDNTINPLDLGPLGDGISLGGKLFLGGTEVASNWALASGPNLARRIIGEGQKMPTPRRIGTPVSGASQFENYGGLMVVEHGPIDSQGPIVAYGNDFTRTLGAPRDTAYRGSWTVEARQPDGRSFPTPGTFTAYPAYSPVPIAPYEVFVVDPETQNASILVPANQHLGRTYRIRLSAYIGSTGPSGYQRVDYVSLSVYVPPFYTVPAGEADVPSLVRIRLADLLGATPLALASGGFGSVEVDSIRVAPQYQFKGTLATGKWTSRATLPQTDPEYRASDFTPIDPFEMKVVDNALGTLLFSPAGREGAATRPGGANEPLVARVDYDVLDWRIIREDFRMTSGPTFTLALQGLKVGSQNGPDGRANGNIWGVSSNSYDPSPTARDNVVIIDLTTGYEVQRYRTNNKDGDRVLADENLNNGDDILVSIDKSRGAVTIIDADRKPENGTQVLLIPPAGPTIAATAEGRPFRVLYRARNEWAVQILKSASQYTFVNSFDVGAGQCYIGGTNSGDGTQNYRIYFPRSDANRKVTIDTIAYRIPGNDAQLLEGQDFVIHPASALDPVNLPYVDITEVLPSNAVFDAAPNFEPQFGQPVKGVKGASVAVRVLWNPDSFNLVEDQATNISRLNLWGRGWRRSTTETFLRAEETR